MGDVLRRGRAVRRRARRAGVARYRELAEAAWADEPELGPGSARAWSSRRYRLSRIMEDLARAEGDIDALVAVLARDRSSPYRYLLIAEALLAAGRAGEATEWAERGLAAFPEAGPAAPRLPLRPLRRVGPARAKRSGSPGRRSKARRGSRPTSGWPASPSRPAVWDSWRERAHDVLRRGPTPCLAGATAPSSWPRCSGKTTPSKPGAKRRREAAAETSGSRSRAAVSAIIPADALEVYSAQIEPAIRHSDNHTYAGAVEWLEKVQAIFTRLEQEDCLRRARPRDPRAAPGQTQPDQAARRARLGATLGEASRTLIAVAPISDTLIHEAARRLGRAARSPARVILFGSYARGEADAESDIDFLVVQQDGFGHRREIVRFQETLSPLRIPAEVLVVQPRRGGAARAGGRCRARRARRGRPSS